MEQRINISPEESAELKAKLAKMEGLSEGYSQGIEAAKQLMLKDFINKKKVTNDSIAKSPNGSTGQTPNRPDEPIPQIQPAGGTDQPERTGEAAIGGDHGISDGDGASTAVNVPGYGRTFPIRSTVYTDAFDAASRE